MAVQFSHQSDWGRKSLKTIKKKRKLQPRSEFCPETVFKQHVFLLHDSPESYYGSMEKDVLSLRNI